jgi:hypothetical protein
VTPQPSLTPNPSPASAFYLRAWYTQAIPPQYTFSWLPPVTISDGSYINGNVAVPAIYPGPLLIVPLTSTISDAGVAAIVAEATRLGLLGEQSDFTGDQALPGAKLGQIEMIVDGKTYELTGKPDLQIVCITAPCEGAPGSPEAFAAFWSDITGLESWLADELGPAEPYDPDRVAVMFSEPETAISSPPATVVAWPLSDPVTAGDCVTLAGDGLVAALPVLESANQATVFTSDGQYLAATARVLVPGEPSPCA